MTKRPKGKHYAQMALVNARRAKVDKTLKLLTDVIDEFEELGITVVIGPDGKHALLGPTEGGGTERP